MQNKSKIVLIIIVAIVMAGGIGLALKIKDLSSNLKSSTNIISDLKLEIEKLGQENGGLRKKIEEAGKSAESQALKISGLGKDRQELTARISSLQRELEGKTNKVSELEKELAPIREVRKQSRGLDKELRKAREVSQGLSRKVSKLEKDNLQLQNNLEKTKNQLDTVSGRTEKKLGERFDRERQKLEADLASAKNYVKLVEKERDDYLTKSVELKENLNKTLKEFSEANKKNKTLQAEVADMHYNLGVILTKQNNFKAAISEFEKALEIKPDDKESHYNLAIIYDEYMKDSKRALEHYRAYLIIAPEGKDAQKVRKWVIDKEAELKVKD